MAKGKSYAFWEMSYTDVQEILKENDVVMVPIGSCEKHGAHIPLSTDSIVIFQDHVKRALLKGRIIFFPLVSEVRIPVGQQVDAGMRDYI